ATPMADWEDRLSQEAGAPGATTTEPEAEMTPRTASGRPISGRLRFGMLLLLAGTFGVNMADRGVIGILVPPIKAEMQLTDAQIGFLIGPMFAIVYALMGLPIATIADRSNRRNLLVATTALFSGATAACALATSYLHL